MTSFDYQKKIKQEFLEENKQKKFVGPYCSKCWNWEFWTYFFTEINVFVITQSKVPKKRYRWVPVPNFRYRYRFKCERYPTLSVHGVMWVSCLLMSTLWIEWPMVAVGLWYGQAYVMDNEHRCILLMAFWMHRDTVTRYWGPLLCHSSTTITSCCSMIMNGPMLQGSIHNSWKLKTSQFLHGQHTHRTCHPLSMFGMLLISVYDTVFQFLPISSNFAQPLKRSGPTFHRSQSTTWSTLCEGDVLHCVRQMVVTPDTDWFSDPPNTVKLHILEWPFIVASLRHTCAIIMLSNQHLDMPHLWGGWIISAKEKFSLTQI